MSSFYPSFGTLPLIDTAIQQGRGAAGAVLGQTYEVRRLDGTTNGSVSSNTPVYEAFPARVQRTLKKVQIENEVFTLLVFVAMCDNRPLQLQDLLTQTGYENDGSVFTFVQARPTRDTLWMRTEFNASITRPMPLAGQAGQQPIGAGVSSPDGYGGVAKDTEEVLTLVDGLYAFSSTPGASPAGIQVGLQPLNRIKDGRSLGTPTDFYREHFLIYAPEIPGEQLNELDVISFPNSDRYEIAEMFTSDLTGISGNIIIGEKMGT
jgi:hypothetical protein